MTKYLFVGRTKENIMNNCVEFHLVACEDCGSVIEINENRGYCGCANYELINNKWIKRD